MAHVQTVTRASGKTAYVVKWRDNGAFRQRTFTVARQAERFAENVETDLSEGKSTAPLVKNSKTFRQVAEDSLAAAKPRLKPRTYEGLVQIYARQVFPTLGSKRIGAITNSDIEKWIAKLTETKTVRTKEPLHPSTIKHAFVSANKVFRYAIKHRLISHNPATGTDLPKVQHAQRFSPVFLSPAEVERLATKLDASAPDGLFVRLASYTGLRAAEIIALQIRDVNLMRRQIEVKRTLVRTKDGWGEDSPKSEKSIRSVPLRRSLAALLQEYIAQHPHRANPQASLWPGRNYGGYGEWRGALDWDKLMDYESFYRRRFRPAAAKIGQPDLRFHDLRHTAASLFVASGMPLARVAAALGHADTATTYKVYLGFFPDDFSADMDRLDAYIGATIYAQPLLHKPVVIANG
ncbi:tyrosine-type recombinase/integrase [Lacisediminihabitans sp. H27-G8]|uniref:tyrosine-type recombinase/integrase n=1 Tax=Lacisediminihabitans sp. H27-G8 TaxID=3111909 RepID=UPI0038FC4704